MTRGQQTVSQRRSRTIRRWLLFCFPVGLLLMWSNRCQWQRWVKSAVSLGIACMVVLLFTLRPPQPVQGGVKYAYTEAVTNIMGPTQTAGAEQYVAYVPKYIPKSTTIIAPTPEPDPFYVYVNDGGKYYHMKKCHYIKKTTPKFKLLDVVTRDFKRCKECNAPTVEMIYGNEMDY